MGRMRRVDGAAVWVGGGAMSAWSEPELTEHFDDAELTAALTGKEINSVETYSEGPFNDDFIVLHFSDGMEFRVRYDWLYGWELRPSSSVICDGGNKA